MSSPNSTFSLWALLVALIMVAASSWLPSSAVDPTTIAAICKKTENSTACKSELGSDPRTSKGDLGQLSLVSLDLAQKHNALSFQTYVDILKNGTWIEFRQFFAKCKGVTQKLTGDLKEARKLSTQKQYKNIKPILAHSNTSVIPCVNNDPINSLAMYRLDRSLRWSLEIAVSVNNYILSHKI